MVVINTKMIEKEMGKTFYKSESHYIHHIDYDVWKNVGVFVNLP